MTQPLYSLVLFTAWTLLLVVGIGSCRCLWVFTGKTPASGFPSGQQHGPDMYWRLNRAHLNALENLPIFATLVITGHLFGIRGEIFGTLSQVVVGARIAQSTFHIASGRSKVVMLRFTAYLVQWLCFAAMAAILLTMKSV